MYTALFDSSLPKEIRVCCFFDAVGFVWHHTSVSLGMCVLLTGMGRMDQSILEPLLLIAVQHGFSLLRYWHKTSYTVIVFLLEIFVQWSIFSNIESYVAKVHWAMAMAFLGIAFTHWLTLCSSTFILVKDSLAIESWK